MLGKLIKHEFKATGRILLLLYAALVFITPLTAAYLRLNTGSVLPEDSVIVGIFNVLSVIIYVVALIGVSTASGIIILYQFYKTMVSKQGYITHTLPVKTSTLVTSKAIVALVWQFVSIAMTALSLISFTKILGFWSLSDINFSELFNLMEQVGISFSTIILFGILVLVGSLGGILMYYASFAIGQRFTGHPIVGAIAAYLGISFIMQIVSSIFSVTLLSPTTLNALENAGSAAAYNSFMDIYLISMIVFLSIFGGILYFITVYMFNKKLNI